MEHIDDLDIRVHHRAQMEAAGLQSILEHCRSFGVAVIDKQLQILQQQLDEDEAKLKELDQRIAKAEAKLARRLAIEERKARLAELEAAR